MPAAELTDSVPTDEAMFESPVGPLIARANADGLTHLVFARRAKAAPRGHADDRARRHLDAVRIQIGEYFEGGRRTFAIPLRPSGSAFYMRVWQALREIPYGQTISYGELARRVGEPDAARAVGAANGANPIVIIVPCHRVIGADGTLVGFGGGLERKRTLLDLEAGRLSLLRA